MTEYIWVSVGWSAIVSGEGLGGGRERGEKTGAERGTHGTHATPQRGLPYLGLGGAAERWRGGGGGERKRGEGVEAGGGER